MTQSPETELEAVDVEAFLKHEVLLSDYTTLRVGGPAQFLAVVKTYKELHAVLAWARMEKQPWVVMGKGSNVLASDQGYPGLVIINRIEGENWSFDGDVAYVSVGSGMALASLAARAAKSGWAGLEFACGIPATIGGAVAMNAGAHGLMIQHCLEEALIWSEGTMMRVKGQNMQFAYRSSRLHQYPEVVVEATFKLHRDSQALERVKAMTEYRLKTQPWKAATAGCFFRNPAPDARGACLSAGAMIEQAGLKGARQGGAQVSSLHANFLVNDEQATAHDFLELCKNIRSEVKQKFDRELEGEVRYLDFVEKRFKTI